MPLTCANKLFTYLRTYLLTYTHSKYWVKRVPSYLIIECCRYRRQSTPWWRWRCRLLQIQNVQLLVTYRNIAQKKQIWHNGSIVWLICYTFYRNRLRSFRAVGVPKIGVFHRFLQSPLRPIDVKYDDGDDDIKCNFLLLIDRAIRRNWVMLYWLVDKYRMTQ